MWAKWNIVLGRKPKGEKLSYGKQLEAVAITSEAAAFLLDSIPPFPDSPSAGLVWHWFTDIQDERPVGMAIERLSSSQIRDWAYLSRIRLPLWAFRMLRRLDRVYCEAASMDDADISAMLFKTPGKDEDG